MSVKVRVEGVKKKHSKLKLRRWQLQVPLQSKTDSPRNRQDEITPWLGHLWGKGGLEFCPR